MPCSRMTASSTPARPRRAPCTFGCSVFTRPSMISGKPVTAETSVTARPALPIARAVPPVEISSKPSAASSRASSTMPVLSDAESNARRAFGLAISSGGQSVFAQLLAQGPAIDAEDRRRAALVAVRVVHDGLEKWQLHLAHDEVVEPAGPMAVQAVEIAAERLLGVVAQRYFAGVAIHGTGPVLCGHCRKAPDFRSRSFRLPVPRSRPVPTGTRSRASTARSRIPSSTARLATARPPDGDGNTSRGACAPRGLL